MNNSLTTTGGSDSKKNFFQRPENITSVLFLALIGIVAYKYGVGLFWGAVGLVGFGLVMALVGLVVTFFIAQRQNIATIWQVLMYKITNFVYSIDPIAVAWSKLAKMKEKRDSIDESVTKLKGAYFNVKRQLDANEKEIANNLERAETLVKMDKKTDAALCVKKAERLKNWNSQLAPLEKTMLTMQNGLKKIYEAANFIITDKEDELTILEKQYNSVKIGWNAIGKAKAIFNSEERLDLEKAINIAGEQMTNNLAEMDRFMEQAAPVLQEVDIENGIRDARIQSLITQMENGDLDKIIDNISNIRSLPEGDKNNTVDFSQQAVKISTKTVPASKSKYDELN